MNGRRAIIDRRGSHFEGTGGYTIARECSNIVGLLGLDPERDSFNICGYQFRPGINSIHLWALCQYIGHVGRRQPGRGKLFSVQASSVKKHRVCILPHQIVYALDTDTERSPYAQVRCFSCHVYTYFEKEKNNTFGMHPAACTCVYNRHPQLSNMQHSQIGRASCRERVW